MLHSVHILLMILTVNEIRKKLETRKKLERFMKKNWKKQSEKSLELLK